MITALIAVSGQCATSGWLGETSLVERAIQKVREIREVERIVLVGELPDLQTCSPESLGVDCMVMNLGWSLVQLANRFTQIGNDGDFYLAVNPLYPFVARGTMEKCLYAVAGMGAIGGDQLPQACATAYGRHEMRKTIEKIEMKPCESASGALVDACVCLRRGEKPTDPKDIDMLAPTRHAGVVTLSALEAIAVDSDEGWRIAETLAENGVTV